MKKIKNASVNQKDRIVCVTVTGAHIFYYQPFKSKERLYLFTTKSFSGSIFAYFRDKGRCMDERGFSLTIKQLYESRKSCRNLKLAKLFDRLPGMIDYVLRERGVGQEEQVMRNNTAKKTNKVRYDDRKLAA